MADSNAQLPAFLQLTPEKETAIRAEQERLRALSNIPRRADPDDARLRHAIDREGAIRANIDVLSREGYTVHTPEMVHSLEQLAEVLLEQGRLGEAFEVVQTEPRRQEIMRYMEAVERDDSERCDCGTKHEYTEKRIPSFKHGNMVLPARRCARCGHTNITPVA